MSPLNSPLPRKATGRLGCIVSMYCAEADEPLSLVRYLAWRTNTWYFPLLVSEQCIVHYQKNHLNLVSYLVYWTQILPFKLMVLEECNMPNQKNYTILVRYLIRQTKMFVSVTTMGGEAGGGFQLKLWTATAPERRCSAAMARRGRTGSQVNNSTGFLSFVMNGSGGCQESK